MAGAALEPSESCQSCGASRPGRFCAACGERRPEPEHDWSLRWLATQLLDAFCGLDGKVPRSLALLLFRPGQLTRAMLAGRRVRYLGPVQLQLLTAVVFYCFFTHAYAAPIHVLANNYAAGHGAGNLLHYDIDTALQAKVVPPDTAAALAARLFERAGQQSKAFLHVLVLPLAVVHCLLLRPRERRFVPNLVAAAHSFTAFLWLDLAFLGCCRLLGMDMIADLAFAPLFAAYTLHTYFALRAGFGCRAAEAAWRALVVAAALVALIVVFRQVVTVLAVATA